MATRPRKERRRAERRPPAKSRVIVGLAPLVPKRKPCAGQVLNVSTGGMAIRVNQVLPAGSHWLLSLPGVDGPTVLLKTVRSHPDGDGHVHGFKFSTIQSVLADRLAGSTPASTSQPRKRR